MTQTIGQRLKAEREEQRLTFEKVFEATRIRIQYLQALESDDLSVMPSPVQARGYLRNYAEYLGFDADQMLTELRAANTQPPSGQVIGPADEQPRISAAEQKSAAVESPVVTAELPEIMEPVVSPAEAPSPRTELKEQESTPPEVTVPIKRKPARRKKTEVQSETAAAEPATKRRGRKKAAPENLAVAETSPEQSSQADENVPHQVELAPELKSAEEPLPSVDVTSPPLEAEIAAGQGAAEPVDAGDSLWQSWLSRLGSVISGRMKRRTLEPKLPPVPEQEPAVLTEPEPPVLIESSQPPVLEDSAEIFREIGRELRSRRELLSLHFDEVERNTHVKAHYLDALERGALDELPSMVQTRGMLSNYATFLDLDVDTLLLRFADALQARHRERNPQRPPRKPGQPIIANMPPVRTFIAGDMIFGVGMAILLVGFAIWGVSRVMAIQSQQEVKPTAPSISDVLLASPDASFSTATATFLPVEAFPGEATVTVEIPTQNVNAPVQLNLIALERTYMRVTVDGEVAFDGRVVPGNAYPFEAEDQVEVLVGSGAAIRTVYNGRDLGLMGTFGQVVNNIYSGTEIITPTGLPSTTPTITLTPTSTAPATATLQSTSTTAPSATAVP